MRGIGKAVLATTVVRGGLTLAVGAGVIGSPAVIPIAILVSGEGVSAGGVWPCCCHTARAKIAHATTMRRVPSTHLGLISSTHLGLTNCLTCWRRSFGSSGLSAPDGSCG